MKSSASAPPSSRGLRAIAPMLAAFACLLSGSSLDAAVFVPPGGAAAVSGGQSEIAVGRSGTVIIPAGHGAGIRVDRRWPRQGGAEPVPFAPWTDAPRPTGAKGKEGGK